MSARGDMPVDVKPTKASPKELEVFMMDLLATVPYYTAYLSRALQGVGVQVHVGSITYYLDPNCFKDRGLKPDPGACDLVGRFPRVPKFLRRILKLAEGIINVAFLSLRFLVRPPAVVHVQYLPLLRSPIPIDYWLVHLCRWRGSRIVLTVHDLLPHDTAEKHKDLYRNLYSEMDALICHSDSIKARLENEFGIQPQRITVIPHGPFFYDLPETHSAKILSSLGVPAGHEMVLWQGIIFPYKGVDLLLDAWKRVEEHSPNVTLVVLGTGDPALTTALKEQASRHGLQRVRFQFRFCATDELAAAYRAASMVIYPYRAITTSGALATGLALGKPIIASKLSVFEELLTDEANALLVDPADPDDLAAAITRLASDTGLRTRLGESVRSMRFGAESWRSIAGQTRALYQRILNASQ